MQTAPSQVVVLATGSNALHTVQKKELRLEKEKCHI